MDSTSEAMDHEDDNQSEEYREDENMDSDDWIESDSDGDVRLSNIGSSQYLWKITMKRHLGYA